MKDKQLISKVRSLKAINPSHDTLKDIKRDVFQQVESETKDHTVFYSKGLFGNIFRFMQSYKLALYSVTLALVLIVLLFMSSIFLPNQFHTTVLYGKLAFASNQYQRSRIALQDMTSRFDD